VEVEALEERPAAWTFARAPVRGIEHLYSVIDNNYRARNRWEFVVRVPDVARGRVEVRPLRVPDDKVLAGLDRRSLTFMPATKAGYTRFRYCQLSLAVPGGGSTRDVVHSGERNKLPYWLRNLGKRIKQKSTVRATKGTDAHSLAVLVDRDDHRMMICLFLATKAWVLKRNVSLKT
jgi:hypothetical protein